MNKVSQAIIYTDQSVIDDCRVLSRNAEGVELELPDAGSGFARGQALTVTLKAPRDTLTRRAKVVKLNGEAALPHLSLRYLKPAELEPGSHRLQIDKVKIDPVCALKIPAALAMRRKILPFLQDDKVVHVACAKQANPGVLASIERMLKTPVCLWVVDAKLLDKVLQRVYGNSAHKSGSGLAAPAGQNQEAGHAAVELSDNLLYAAFVRGASDIHIDPGYQGARIRFRVDGQLELYEAIKSDIYTELSSRLKVLAGLDIAEKRAPQDGRFAYDFAGGVQRVDVRVATLPTKYGERITMRLLAVQTGSLTLDKLGFSAAHQQQIDTFLRRIQGMMILTGPTGSGKTTTLYAAIRMLLAERNVNIITVEDPIEYEIDGVAQCEVDSVSGKLDFARALRSILRHDPDVVMIGEIRDRETADIAIKAALTGHMVFGTLHTNSAAASITRLIDMGVEPYLVAAALRLAVAQRLLRRLCKFCRIDRPLTELEALALNRTDLKGKPVYDAGGCVYCGNSGYSGRIGLYELLELHEDWARRVAEGGTESDLVGQMRAAGVKSLVQDAIDKMLEGETSFQEVMQIASSW